jgi:broad specificity phosphatase PhoE
LANQCLVQAPGLEQVVLARHGETEWNRVRRRQGQLDSPLTERGLMQARALATCVAALSVDAIVASPLGRAAATAAVCGEQAGLAVMTVPELAEVDHGQMAGLTSADIERLFPGELGRRASDKYHWRFPGGESYADADQRAATALAGIARSGARRPLVVSHEMIGRMLRRHLVGADPVTALSWNQPHGVVYRIDAKTCELAEFRTKANKPG